MEDKEEKVLRLTIKDKDEKIEKTKEDIVKLQEEYMNLKKKLMKIKNVNLTHPINDVYPDTSATFIDNETRRMKNELMKIDESLSDCAIVLAASEASTKTPVDDLWFASLFNSKDTIHERKNKDEKGTKEDSDDAANAVCTVIRKQIEISQALHGLEGWKYRLILLQDTSTSFIHLLRQIKRLLLDDQSKTDVQCMNDLLSLEKKMRRLEQLFKERIGSQEKELQSIQIQIEWESSKRNLREDGEGAIHSDSFSDSDDFRKRVEELMRKASLTHLQTEERTKTRETLSRQNNPIELSAI